MSNREVRQVGQTNMIVLWLSNIKPELEDVHQKIERTLWGWITDILVAIFFFLFSLDMHFPLFWFSLPLKFPQSNQHLYI